MSETTREKDVLSLRTAIVCVGLSGVFLAFFAWLSSTGTPPWAAILACAAVGAVVGAVGLFNAPSARLSRPGRILAFWLLAALLVLEIMIPLNYVGVRRHHKWDWTENKTRTLSDMTLKVLDRVEKPVQVTTFFVQEDMRQKTVFNVVKDLLDQYQRNNRNIVVEHVDPSRDTERTFAKAKELNIEDPRELTNFIYFQAGPARKDVPVSALFAPMPGEDYSNPEEIRPEQIGFAGEEMFTSALLELSDKNRKEIWFVTDHGELSPEGDLYDIASALRRTNYRVEKFDTLGDGVPDNCSVLVILRPRPTAPFKESELASLGKYLAEGGKLLVGVNGGGFCGFEPLLSDFGIEMGRNYIIDQTSGNAQLTVGVNVSGYSEVVRNLRDLRMTFKAARTVGAAEALPSAIAPPRRQAYNLLSTGPACWSTADVDAVEQGRFIRFDSKTDKKGPLSVAAYYEQPDRNPDGALIPKGRPKTRIIAVGSGDFIAMQRMPLANVQFFFNAINWLAEKEDLISIPPKRFDYRPMDKLSDPQASFVFWLTTVIMPAVVLVLGCVIWLVRRAL